jgi:4'-phosphopantetheinyl transferase EntD
VREFDACSAATRSLLPETVAVAAAPITAPAYPLYPVEAEQLGDVVASRRHEFALGRTCARRALATLGVDTGAILVGARRAPVWPAGVVGSITHTRTSCIAAVARSEDILGVGIDAEELQELPPAVADLVLTLEERDDSGPHAELIAFSAKEAIYKLWWPLAGSWLDFEDVRVRLDHSAGTFLAEICPRTAGCMTTVVDGRFAVTAGMVLTAVVVAS